MIITCYVVALSPASGDEESCVARYRLRQILVLFEHVGDM